MQRTAMHAVASFFLLPMQYIYRTGVAQYWYCPIQYEPWIDDI